MDIRKIASYTFFFICLLFLGCKTKSQALTSEQQSVIKETKNNFVFVEGGSFIMGTNLLLEARPAHKVTLDDFSISKYETTWKEFDVFTILNDKEKIASDYREVKEFGFKYPAKWMNWYQARAYCQWLGKQLDLPIDLPTEAQWEYAARSRGLDVEHATNNGNIEGSYTQKRNYPVEPSEVGTYPPNPLGLYDMSGGRPEWVLDWTKAYSEEDQVNPIQDSVYYSKKKIVRGWHSLRYSVYQRGKRPPENDGSGVGFRCVCNQKTPVE